MEPITIEEAIAKVSGDYRYQKRALYSIFKPTHIDFYDYGDSFIWFLQLIKNAIHIIIMVIFSIIGIPILAFIVFSWNIWVIIIAYFFVGILEIGIYTPGFILMTESIKHRTGTFFQEFTSAFGVYLLCLSQ